MLMFLERAAEQGRPIVNVNVLRERAAEQGCPIVKVNVLIKRELLSRAVKSCMLMF